MRWALPALLIALTLVVTFLALADTPTQASRALPANPAPYILALRERPALDPTAAPTEAAIQTGSVGSEPAATLPRVKPAPTSTPRHSVGTVVRFLRGEATWWDSWGHGFYVAVNPSDGIRVGSIIQVCDAHAQNCRAAPVTTTCACKGRDSGRIVDLSLDLFRLYADPSRGTTTVVLEVTQ